MAGARVDEAYSSCRFYVELKGVVQGVFTEISGLQIEVEVMDYQEGGNNNVVYRLPGITKPGRVTLKRGMTRSNDLFKWCTEVANGTLNPRTITIMMFDTKGNQVMRWEFSKAYPVKWVGPDFRAADAAAAIETLELVYEAMKLA